MVSTPNEIIINKLTKYNEIENRSINLAEDLKLLIKDTYKIKDEDMKMNTKNADNRIHNISNYTQVILNIIDNALCYEAKKINT